MDSNVGEENHQTFLRSYEGSELAVLKMADYLNRQGFSVRLPPRSTSPSVKDWKEHADDGDMFVEVRGEVKQLSRHFTCREDWPFDIYIVCGKDAYDRAKPKPRFFYHLSACGKYAGVLNVRDTYEQWKSKRVRDSRYENEYSQDVYYCSPDVVDFIKL